MILFFKRHQSLLVSAFVLLLLLMSFVANAGTGKPMNPDISFNFLGLAQYGDGLSNDRSADNKRGLSLQEAELQGYADVDPYLRASLLLSIAKEEGEWGIDPEEVFLETIALPLISLKAGKFKLAVDKHNTLHTHAYPFINAPLINDELLGEEGLNETGVSASLLLPISWYSEFTLQVFDGSNEKLFNGTKSGETAQLVQVKNLWDLSDDLTMELSFSGAQGKNSVDKDSSLYGGDLIFKWRPANGGKYHALIWATEYLAANRRHLVNEDSGLSVAKLGGLASWLQYQFAQRWWIQARVDQLGINHSEGLRKKDRQSALLGFFPSEFSGFRLQYDHTKIKGASKDEHTVSFQYNITIGAHPAHSY